MAAFFVQLAVFRLWSIPGKSSVKNKLLITNELRFFQFWETAAGSSSVVRTNELNCAKTST